MNPTKITIPTIEAYALFESRVREGFKLLKIEPESIVANIIYVNLPTFTNPSNELELKVKFPGAICLIYFGQSEIDT